MKFFDNCSVSKYKNKGTEIQTCKHSYSLIFKYEDKTAIDLEESDGVVNGSWLYFYVPDLRLDEDMEEVLRTFPLTDD